MPFWGSMGILDYAVMWLEPIARPLALVHKKLVCWARGHDAIYSETCKRCGARRPQ